MARSPSRRRGSDGPSSLVAGVITLGPLAASGFYQQPLPEDRLILVVATIVTLVSGLAALVLLRIHLRIRRALAWRRALRHWSQNVRPGGTPTFSSAGQLLPRELERFAAQVYAQMGYQVTHAGRLGDEGADVKLLNPEGQVELVQCKQWNRPVGEPDVRDLYGAMRHERAVKAFLWAPAGFTPAAVRWAKGKPLVLADNREIARLVESAYSG